MTAQVQISANCSFPCASQDGFGRRKLSKWLSLSRPDINSSNTRIFSLAARSWQRQCFSVMGKWRSEAWFKDGACKKQKEGKRMVLVRFNQGFGFNGGGGSGGGGGGGGGGGRIDNNTARLLGNIALAVGLTYLSMTGQLGWILDAIVSIWLIVFIVPIVGVGAFLWWAGRDMVISSCPNCGNEFQIFKSTINDELQLCPFCSQPFSVVDDKFVKEPVKFYNEPASRQQFGSFSSGAKKGRGSKAVIDVEAEVKDVD